MKWRVLKLDSSYRPIQIISWQDAISMVLTDRAVLVESRKDTRINSANKSFPVPAVIAIKRYVNKGRISLFQPVPPYIRFSHWDGSHGQDLEYARNPPASNRGFASFRLERVPGSSP